MVWVRVLLFSLILAVGLVRTSLGQSSLNYNDARWDPIHRQPAILQAENQDCLKCHAEVLDSSVLPESVAGLKASETLAWYQTLDTYQGDQRSFHWRHMESPYAKQVMNLKCNFCHQGNDLREEAPSPPTGPQTGFTLRKMVDTDKTCLKCHGTMNWQVMTLPAPLPGPWPTCRDRYQNDCLSCHAVYRTVRHQVNYLNADKIEELAKLTNLGGDVCYGCHGGRAWYRNGYPYPRHPYPGMDKIPTPEPEWSADRPKESEPRYALPVPSASGADDPAAATPAVSPTSLRISPADGFELGLFGSVQQSLHRGIEKEITRRDLISVPDDILSAKLAPQRYRTRTTTATNKE